VTLPDADEGNGSSPEEPGAGTTTSPGRMEVVEALAALNRGAQESTNPLDANPKRQRARFSVARKMFYEDTDLYLQLDPSMPQPSSTPPLVGQVVVACPSQKNNYNYTIRWVCLRSGGEWPTHLISHLRTMFPKQCLQTLLPALISICPLNQHNHSGVDVGGSSPAI
jgi:hypothetical protein